MVSLRGFIVGVGLIGLAIAGWLLFARFSADGVSCGSVMSGDRDRAERVDKFERIRGNTSTAAEECVATASTRQTAGWILGGVGAVAVAGAVMIRPSQPRAA